MINTIRIYKSNYAYLVEYIAKLNKRAEKLKANKIEILGQKEIMSKDEDDISYVSEMEITISYDTISIGKYRVLANINHTYDNGNIINVIDKDYEVDKRFYTIEGRCEHCNINHHRKTTYLINDENGNLKQIGKSCLKDYTGYNIDRVLNLVELIDNIEDYIASNYNDTSLGNKYAKEFKTVNILNIVKILMDRHGYVSSRKQEQILETQGRLIDTTSECVKSILFNRADTNNEELKEIYGIVYNMNMENEVFEEVESALKWIRDMKSEEITSSYLNNLKVLSGNEYINNKQIGYVSSLLVAYDNATNTRKNVEPKEGKKQSEFIGIVGEKTQHTVVLKKVIPTESMYGTSFLHIFEDEEGNILTWFTSRRNLECDIDEKINIKFTVKEHKVYNGTNQTVILRVKKA